MGFYKIYTKLVVHELKVHLRYMDIHSSKADCFSLHRHFSLFRPVVFYWKAGTILSKFFSFLKNGTNPELQIRGGIKDNSKISFISKQKTYVLTPY